MDRSLVRFDSIISLAKPLDPTGIELATFRALSFIADPSPIATTTPSDFVVKNSMGKVGFIGLGIMGKPMASNLLKAGFEVVVYNRTQAKCDELVKLGATAAKTPAEVVGACDTTVCMLADPKACLEVALGENGITSAIEAGKAVVDMSTVDAATSAQIYEAVKAKGGRFLEAPVSGSKKPAEDGALVILGAGDKDVYDESLPLFEVMGKKSVYLGDIGNGAKMKLVVNMMLGCMTTTVSARADEAKNRTRERERERERER